MVRHGLALTIAVLACTGTPLESDVQLHFDAGALTDARDDVFDGTDTSRPSDAATPTDANNGEDDTGVRPDACSCDVRPCNTTIGCEGRRCGYAPVEDGEACVGGVCVEGACAPAGCGNGWREAGEACDDGVHGDGPCNDVCEPTTFQRPGRLVGLASDPNEVLAFFHRGGSPGQLVVERFAAGGRSRGAQVVDDALWRGVAPRPSAVRTGGGWLMTWRTSGERVRAPAQLALLHDDELHHRPASADSTEDVALCRDGEVHRYVVSSTGGLRRETIDPAGRVLNATSLETGVKEVACGGNAYATVVANRVALSGMALGSGREIAMAPDGGLAYAHYDDDPRGDVWAYGDAGHFAIAATDAAERAPARAGGTHAWESVDGVTSLVHAARPASLLLRWENASQPQLAPTSAGTWMGATTETAGEGRSQLGILFTE